MRYIYIIIVKLEEAKSRAGLDAVQLEVRYNSNVRLDCDGVTVFPQSFTGSMLPSPN